MEILDGCMYYQGSEKRKPRRKPLPCKVSFSFRARNSRLNAASIRLDIMDFKNDNRNTESRPIADIYSILNESFASVDAESASDTQNDTKSHANLPNTGSVTYTVGAPFLRAASKFGIRKPLPLLIAAQVEYFSSRGQKCALTKSNKTLIAELYPDADEDEKRRRDKALEKAISRLIKTNVLKSYSSAVPSKRGKNRALAFHTDFTSVMAEFAEETETVSLCPSINRWLELNGVEAKAALILLSHINTITNGTGFSWRYSKQQVDRFGIPKSSYSTTIRLLVDLGAIYKVAENEYRVF